MKNILLVEDDAFISDIYAMQLKKGGFGVDVANTGEMALEKLKNHKPDLLLLDIGLPGISGWEVLGAVRQDPVLADVKAIVISNNSEKEAADNISSLGVLKYFLKIETTPDEILAAVKEILK